MSHLPVDPFQQRQIVYEEHDPYRVTKKNARTIDSDSSEFDIVHSRTASDSSTSKLYNSAAVMTEYDDPYRKHKPFNREPERANSYLPYSHHRRDPNQPPALPIYIEEYIPHTSTSLGVNSMLHDSLAEQINSTSTVVKQPTYDKESMIEELSKKRKRKRKQRCCGLKSAIATVVLLLVILAIICYFVWPRVPNLSVADVDDNVDIQVNLNTTKKSISTQWKMNLTADNSANWVPTRITSIDLQIYDESTTANFGNGSSGFMILPPRKRTSIIIPMTIHYEPDSVNDTTFQHLYNACNIQSVPNAPSENRQDVLNVTLHVSYHIAGIVWTPTTNITVHRLICPRS
ncbi:hypothetical protein CU097_006105 [Rhizopus azygosporus]|uniref:Late embryogenesis abundant protein LEA-2 subgroup domain-containing protein n=1 Tax=Rhizopus azygosporus TaxID=86630 RepID=A0A367JEU5_RHIAZ|nr:hypothetical protein CU097_006105 [Rhizopus azygosporus]